MAVLFLLAVGAALVVGSFVGGDTANMQPLFNGGVAGLITVLVATPFLFVGFDVIPQSADEINMPYRKIGQLLLISVAMAVGWYVLIMLTVGSSLPAGDLAASDLAAADGMAALWGSDLMGRILVIGGIAGILTSWNGFLIGASRLLYALGQSGMVPSWFGRLNRFRTPGNALLFIGALSVVAPFFGRQTLVWMVDAGGLSITVSYIMVAVSFVVLRRREPEMDRPFRAPGGRATGVLAAVLALGLGAMFLPGMPAALVWPYEWLILVAWWVLGLVFLLRLPSVGPGPDGEARILAARGR